MVGLGTSICSKCLGKGWVRESGGSKFECAVCDGIGRVSDRKPDAQREFVEHNLKTWPEFFEAIWRRQKLFELRQNDRDYQVGDLLSLQEYEFGHLKSYTGRVVKARIDYVLRDTEGSQFGLVPGYCIMSITPLHNIDVSAVVAPIATT